MENSERNQKEQLIRIQQKMSNSLERGLKVSRSADAIREKEENKFLGKAVNKIYKIK